jgi:hypothetical protein
VALVTIGHAVSSLPVPPPGGEEPQTATACDPEGEASVLNLKIIIGSTRPGRAATRPRTSAAAKILLDDLAWWARALRRARPGGTLPAAAFRLMAVKEGAGK